MKNIAWKEEYNVGCESVDLAHKKIFSVIRKVDQLVNYNEYERDKFACIEAIKFLREYTITHFMQEEAFMKELGYQGYDKHKEIHDALREKTLPHLIKELERTEFSRESVKKFLATFIAWLSGHILIEDRAITGRTKRRS